MLEELVEILIGIVLFLLEVGALVFVSLFLLGLLI